MKAVVLDAVGDSTHFKLKEVNTPVPKSGEVRIRIKSFGFNPVDFKMRQGLYPIVPPVVLGADCAGVIDAIGADVAGFKEGDEVMALVFGQGSNGTYAEYVCVPFPFVVKKPWTFSFDQAAGFPLAALTAYRTLIPGRVNKKHHSVFITAGAGGVGHLALQLARYFKIKSIFTTAGSSETADFLTSQLQVHPSHLLFYKGLSIEEMKKTLLEKNAGKPIEQALDLVGGSMRQLCFECVELQGHVATILKEKNEANKDAGPGANELAFSKSLSLHLVFVGTEAFFGNFSSWHVYQEQLEHLREIAEDEQIMPIVQNVGELSAETVRKAHHLLEQKGTKGKLVARVG